MQGIQAQHSVSSQPTVNFKSSNVSFKSAQYDDDSFDRDAIEADRDEKIDKINETRGSFDELADELENSDNKFAQKASKGVRFLSAAFGLAATFVAAKYSSKFAIETLKSCTKSQSVQSIIKTVKSAEGPAKKVAESVVKTAKSIIDKPVIKDNIKKVIDSNVGQKVVTFIKNDKVAKVLEPFKNTLKSIKDIKFNGAKIQNIVENTMAATTTGSVLVDDLAGRNDDKSNMDLAAGV